jgi:hypothetical protein
MGLPGGGQGQRATRPPGGAHHPGVNFWAERGHSGVPHRASLLRLGKRIDTKVGHFSGLVKFLPPGGTAAAITLPATPAQGTPRLRVHRTQSLRKAVWPYRLRHGRRPGPLRQTGSVGWVQGSWRGHPGQRTPGPAIESDPPLSPSRAVRSCNPNVQRPVYFAHLLHLGRSVLGVEASHRSPGPGLPLRRLPLPRLRHSLWPARGGGGAAT